MALRAPPIDFVAARKALVQAIALGTGLDAGSIIRAQAQGPVQPPPKRPYCTFFFRTVSMRTAFRDCEIAANAVSSTAFYTKGHRGIAVDLNFFGEDQDQAYSLATCMQSALFVPDVRSILTQANFAVWQIGDVTDVTALLNTGYEGRAMLEFQMWTSAATLYDPGEIDAVPLLGAFADGLGLD